MIANMCQYRVKEYFHKNVVQQCQTLRPSQLWKEEIGQNFEAYNLNLKNWLALHERTAPRHSIGFKNDLSTSWTYWSVVWRKLTHLYNALYGKTELTWFQPWSNKMLGGCKTKSPTVKTIFNVHSTSKFCVIATYPEPAAFVDSMLWIRSFPAMSFKACRVFWSGLW